MALRGVPEVAASWGVSPRRVRQLIDAGSLPATRVAGRWLVEETAVEAARERWAGRPLSWRSAWAVVLASLEHARPASRPGQPADANTPGGRAVPAESWWVWWAGLDGTERARARARWNRLSAAVQAVPPGAGPGSEEAAADVASSLRSLLSGRARRVVLSAMADDVPDLRADPRVAGSGVSSAAAGISAGTAVEGYVRESDVVGLRRDYLLRGEGWRPGAPTRPGAGGGDVVLHVVIDELPGPVPVAAGVLVAADLVQWRGAREDARAVELLGAAAAYAGDVTEHEAGRRGGGGTA